MRRPRLMFVAISFLVLLAGCESTPIRYHYPHASGDVDLALARLETTVERAKAEGGARPPHAVALEAIADTRAALDLEPLREDVAALALARAARKLEAAAELARVAIPRERDGGERDRLYDLEAQARRASRETRVLGRDLFVAAEKGASLPREHAGYLWDPKADEPRRAASPP